MNISQARQVKAQCRSTVDRIMAQAKRDKRELTGQEQAELDRNLAMAREANETIEKAAADVDIRQQIDALSSTTTGGFSVSGSRGGSLGEQFVASGAWDWLQGTQHSRPAGQWSTPSVELQESGLQAATLTEDAASGGDLVVPRSIDLASSSYRHAR